MKYTKAIPFLAISQLLLFVTNCDGNEVILPKSLLETDSWWDKCLARGEKPPLEDCIDNTQDSVRFYILCKHCLSKMEYSGLGEAPEVRAYRIC